MNFIKGRPEHVAAIMGWFPDARSCLIWGGPDFRFPFSADTFAQDTRAATLPTYVLTGPEDEVLGFGQYYLRAGRCHFARLAISPSHRARGLGRILIARLAQVGVRDLATHECSLFVLADNLPAVRLYEKLGFTRTSYPAADGPALAGVEYMIVASDALLQSAGADR